MCARGVLEKPHLPRISFHRQCPRLTSLSKAPPPPLGTRHESNQVDLDSSDSEELDLSNYDESSGGNNNHLILELHSLRSVYLHELPKLASLPQWLLQASDLEDFSIVDCKELDICKDESGNNNNLILDFHGGLHHSLRSVIISSLPKLASLPQWLLQASNLERLSIWGCSNLKALPEQIEALQSLQRLEIVACPSLTSLPEGMRRLASLTHLIIYECPKLERRCKRDGGEDWDKIAHIPHITRDPFSLSEVVLIVGLYFVSASLLVTLKPIFCIWMPRGWLVGECSKCKLRGGNNIAASPVRDRSRGEDLAMGGGRRLWW
ncbi:hypothetical protein NL676_000031 [Syzygium grande]|nr:hypothetical protein NL676_000031 [Syzygium grande]